MTRRLIRDLGASLEDAVLGSVGRTVSRLQESTALEADLLESDDRFLAIVDTPGAAASDVQVRFVEGAILIRIDRFRDHREGFEMRYPGRGLALDGRVELPPGASVDPTAATATLRSNGTLAVEIPKVDEDSDDPDGDEPGDDTIDVEDRPG